MDRKTLLGILLGCGLVGGMYYYTSQEAKKPAPSKPAPTQPAKPKPDPKPKKPEPPCPH